MSAVLPTYARFDLTFDRGEGTFLITEDGERYLDFASGVAVNVLGHAHPDLVAALTEQAGKVWHTSNLFKIPGQEQLAKRLCAATFADKVFFTNSGAEAMECAIKMARRFHHVNGAGERFRMIALEGAFHGRTLATIAAGGQDKLLDGFGPPVDGFDHVPPGDLDAVEAAIGAETAAILAEPIQGEGGVRALSSDYLKGLREICDRHGILLILDEIQCGMGRTGMLFAHELAGITPDIMAIAKGIGGGFPVGACLATENAAKGMVAGTHGSTYGGNPLAMAVAGAVLTAVQEPGFLDEVKRKSLRFKQLLAQLRDEHGDIIEGVRGEGLMIGLKLKVAPKDLVAALIDAQMLTVPAGDNVVRLLPPLNVCDDDLVDAASRIDRACAHLKAKAVSEPEPTNT